MLTALTMLRFSDSRLLTDQELVAIGLTLLLGGFDTVTNTLSLIIDDFATNPGRRHAFIDIMSDEGTLQLAVAELVRFHTVFPPARRVKRDCVFHGLELHRNDIVVLDAISASRDAREFSAADELDFRRQPNGHLAFGHGRHRCLGLHLARAEIEVALLELHRRMPDYRIQAGRKARISSGNMRGLDDLPIAVASAGGPAS